MESYKKGDLTESIVRAELKRRDISVSEPFGDNERYDMIAETPDNRLVRLQIKTGRLRNGAVVFQAQSQHTNTQGSTFRQYGDRVDYFCVYCDAVAELYLIDVDEVGAYPSLKLNDTGSGETPVTHAEEYEFDNQWPPDDPAEQPVDQVEMPPNRRGDATEAHVIAELQRREIPICRPVTDNERYDVIVVTPSEKFLKIQIKTGWMDNGCVLFKTETSHVNASGTVRKPYDDEIDYFLVYAPPLQQLYLITPDNIPETPRLRVEEPEQVDRTIRWASEYEFDERWPPGPTSQADPSIQSTLSIVTDEIEQREIPILTPSGDDRPYDIVLETPDGEYHRVRVETGHLIEGRLRFIPPDPEEFSTEEGEIEVRHAGIDQFLVYSHELEEMFLIAEDAFDRNISLRVEEPKEMKKTINWASDFRFDANWPPCDQPSTNTYSAVGRAIAALRDHNISLTEPTGDKSDCDVLVFTPEGDQLHIAVEPAWVYNGRLRLKPDRYDEIDAYLVYCRELDTCYWVDASEFNVSISLRVEEPDQYRDSINWAEDYELEHRWPPAEPA